MAKVKIEIEADDPLVTKLELSNINAETVTKLIQAVVWVYAECFMQEMETENGRYEGFFDAVRGEHGAKFGARGGDGPRLAFARTHEVLEMLKGD